MRQQVLTDPERRRRWSDAEKIAIVREASRGDRSVAEVARAHNVNRQQIYQWRTALRRGLLVDETGSISGPTFVMLEDLEPVTAPDPERETPAAEPAPEGTADPVIDLVLGNGRVLRVPASIPGAALTRLIRAAEAA